MGYIVTTLSNLKSSATAIDGEQAVAAVAGGWCIQDKHSSAAQVFHAGFFTGVIACDSWPEHKLKHMQATMLTDGSCDVDVKCPCNGCVYVTVSNTQASSSLRSEASSPPCTSKRPPSRATMQAKSRAEGCGASLGS